MTIGGSWLTAGKGFRKFLEMGKVGGDLDGVVIACAAGGLA
jgi:hypothetical protein